MTAEEHTIPDRLPEGTHARVLTGTDVVSGEELAYTVVWADHGYDRCPTCEQEIERVADCPVLLNTGAGQSGEIEEYSQQHGCGEQLWVEWVEVEDASPEAVLAAAQELSDALREEIDASRREIRERLRDELAEALARLAEPLAPGEDAADRAEDVRTGSDTDPGVVQDGERWMAWDYDPDGDAEGIVVTAAEIEQG